MADALNKKFDSDGHLIEWTDYHGYTHVNTKQIAKDLNLGKSDNSSYSNSHPSCGIGFLIPDWLLIILAIVFVGIIIAAACAFAFMIFKPWAAITFTIILASFFFGTVIIIKIA